MYSRGPNLIRKVIALAASGSYQSYGTILLLKFRLLTAASRITQFLEYPMPVRRLRGMPLALKA